MAATQSCGVVPCPNPAPDKGLDRRPSSGQRRDEFQAKAKTVPRTNNRGHPRVGREVKFHLKQIARRQQDSGIQHHPAFAQFRAAAGHNGCGETLCCHHANWYVDVNSRPPARVWGDRHPPMIIPFSSCFKLRRSSQVIGQQDRPRNMGKVRKALLLRQFAVALNPELGLRLWSARSRLSSADAQAIGSSGHQSVAGQVHHAQVARV